MKVLSKMSLVLGIVAFASGFLLAYVNQLTIDQIRKNQEKAIADAIFKLVPEGKTFDLKLLSNFKVYYIYDKDGNLLSYCILAAGNGYQGEIKLLIALEADLLTLRGIEILENVETPGLGGKITSSSFKGQFEGKKFSPQLNYVKGRRASAQNEIEAITGATVSSSSVVKIINASLQEAIPLLKGDER